MYRYYASFIRTLRYILFWQKHIVTVIRECTPYTQQHVVHKLWNKCIYTLCVHVVQLVNLSYPGQCYVSSTLYVIVCIQFSIIYVAYVHAVIKTLHSNPKKGKTFPKKCKGLVVNNKNSKSKSKYSNGTAYLHFFCWGILSCSTWCKTCGITL